MHTASSSPHAPAAVCLPLAHALRASPRICRRALRRPPCRRGTDRKASSHAGLAAAPEPIRPGEGVEQVQPQADRRPPHIRQRRQKAPLLPSLPPEREDHTRPNTSVAFVPPKPKLFDITLSNRASCVERRIGKPSARGSSVVMFAEPAMKPSRITGRAGARPMRISRWPCAGFASCDRGWP